MENREKIYIDRLNDITESDLIIDNDDLENNITSQYILVNLKTSNPQYYVPIKVKIKSIIEDTKIAMNEIRHIKTEIIPITRKHIKRLKRIIKLSEDNESFFSEIDMEQVDEMLKTIKVFDGWRDERKIAINSYKKQLHQAKKKLKQFSSNYKTMKKNNLVNCRNAISKLLDENGIRTHKADAQNLMNWNGVDTPVHL